MMEYEEKYGSVIKGFLAEPADETGIEQSFGDLEKSPLLTLRGGMKQLCDRMADVLGESLHTGSAVTDLSLLLKEYDKVISTLPAYVLSGLRSEEHTSELQSLMRISYAV